MEKFEIGKSVVEQLNSTEMAIDEAMIGAAALLSGILDARQKLHVSPAKVQVALTRSTEAVAALTEARRAASAAHAALDSLWREIDGRTTGTGADCPFDCPSNKGAIAESEQAPTTLRIAG